MGLKNGASASSGVVVVTGASTVVGRAAAVAFGRAGARVALVARGEEGLKGAVEEIVGLGGWAKAFPADLADPKRTEEVAVVDELQIRSGAIIGRVTGMTPRLCAGADKGGSGADTQQRGARGRRRPGDRLDGVETVSSAGIRAPVASRNMMRTTEPKGLGRMTEIEIDPAAIRAYQRTLTEVVENQVVDAAEDVIAWAWIAELDEMRRAGLRLAMAARLAERVAQERLRIAQVSGRPGELARAHARFAQVEAEMQRSLEHAHALLASVDAEIEAVCRAGLDRARRTRLDLHRLCSAWTAANGRV